METRSISEEYAKIGTRLIKRNKHLAYIANSEATILYLSSDLEKRTKDSIINAVCEKVDDKNKWAIPADFLIVVYEPNVANMSKKQIEILILHELMHIGIEYKGGRETYYVKDHEYEDFGLIIDRYGRDWAKPMGEVEIDIEPLII